MSETRYTLKEAVAYLKTNLFDLVAQINERKVAYHQEGKTIFFLEDDLAHYQQLSQQRSRREESYSVRYGPLSLRKAIITLEEKIEEKTSLHLSYYFLKKQLLNDINSRIVRATKIYFPKKSGNRRYLSERDFDKILNKYLHQIEQEKELIRESYSKREGVAYLTCRIKEEFFSQDHQHYLLKEPKIQSYLNKIVEEQKIKLRFLNQVIFKKEELEQLVAKHYSEFDHLKNYFSTEEAAYLLRSRMIGKASKVPSPGQLQTRFHSWIALGHLSGERGTLPFYDHREKWFVQKERLEEFIENYVSSGFRLRLPSQEDYQNALFLIKGLQERVEQHFNVSLPKKITISKPRGRYATIKYHKEELYGAKAAAYS
ncbi:hypothetical protein HZC32_00635 [Candidatus Woesearchaeota archaeon]|nr:hypothetical protein [Candidatus Woesearchaeota archaeon]